MSGPGSIPFNSVDPESLANELYDKPMQEQPQEFPDVPVFKLSEHDKDSAVFKKLLGFYKQKLDSLREENDNSSVNAIDTSVLRGRIAEVKEFLALGDEPTVEEVPEAPDLGY